jgi:DNA invertase Pin-like site-specific DNA recombinase
MDRSALKRLLDDVETKKIDTIVVYKVDRLTRSLADFTKIVEALEARGVSFVSVTQQFNTTSSMGRLTLNVLLSVAQFEREVTGERIRDKIAASKRKGMWMGGTLPLGYDLKDRKLVVDREEARVVRNLFKSVSCSGMRPKAEDTSRSRRNQEQGENQRSGEPFRGNFVFPRSALSDPEKPHLPRRDSPPGPESSRPTQGDCPARTLGPSAGKVE